MARSACQIAFQLGLVPSPIYLYKRLLTVQAADFVSINLRKNESLRMQCVVHPQPSSLRDRMPRSLSSKSDTHTVSRRFHAHIKSRIKRR